MSTSKRTAKPKAPVNWQEVQRFPIKRVNVALFQPMPGDFSDGDVSVSNCAGYINVSGAKAADGNTPQVHAYLIEDGKPRPDRFFSVKGGFAIGVIFIPTALTAAYLASSQNKNAVMLVGGNGSFNGVELG